MFVGLVEVEVSRSLGFFPARLSEEVQSGTVLPLRTLNADIMCWQPGPPYAPVCVLHQSDGNTTIDVSVRPRAGFPKFCSKAAG